MVEVKANSTEVIKPKPKYGHLSQLNPEWALLKDAVDKEFTVSKSGIGTNPASYPMENRKLKMRLY